MRIFRLLLLCMMTTLLVACDQSSETVNKKVSNVPNPAQVLTPPGSKQMVVALILKTHTNPYFVAMEQGARRAEKEYGIKLIEHGGSQENYVQEQIQVVEETIAAKVDAIVIAPSDSALLVPALKKAQDAGIVLINVDNPLDSEAMQNQHMESVPMVSIDNEAAGYQVVRAVIDQVKRPTKVAIVEGMPGAENGRLRVEGALRAFKENHLIKLVAREPADWQIEKAYRLAQKLFTIHPDIGVVFCANDMMALGVAHYAEENHRKDLQVIGYDALPEALSEIKAGRLTATLDQQADEQGYQAVVFAIRRLRGERVPDLFQVNAKVITAATLKQGPN